MNNLNNIFSADVIKELKNNKDLITFDLLCEIRSFGNEGKKIALDILDLEMDSDSYYLDAFGNRISYKGNRRLKKPFTKLALSQIHHDELKRCAEDIHYFKDNYVKIKTKTGVNFPDIRPYQNDFIDVLKNDDESIVSLQGRQSGKTVSTGMYAGHKYIFSQNINIGIVGNKGKQAREFLNVIKNIVVDLPIWMQPGTTVWNKGSIETEAEMRILTDVPSGDSFRGFTIALLIVDEAAFIRPTLWEEFSDSIFPSQSALSWKKNIIISTAKGMNHFYDMVEGARKGENGFTVFEVNWRDVPRYNSDGTQMNPDDFKAMVIKKYGILYFEQNYGNSFIGSSYTLIRSDILKKMEPKRPNDMLDGKLKIYESPKANHKYIMAVDAAKDGKDFFAIQIVDVTDMKFKQVATAELQIDYLLMPDFIHEWCEYYNKPYLIIENNEGAGQSIADQMMRDYEYENLHFDKDIGRNRKKKYPGFRTTSKSRKQVLQTMKLFIENDKLEINDKRTIDQFFRFILRDGKFQADENSHDDMIMSLALIFALFTNTKNFDDMRQLINNIYNYDSIDEDDKSNFSDFLVVGNFDDGTDIDTTHASKPIIWNGFEINEL